MSFLAAVLVGLGSTHNVGEPRGPYLHLAADARRGPVEVEGWYTTAPKVEPGDGWASRVGLDIWSGPLSIGAHWAHRETSRWHKDRLFVRASAQHGPLRLLAEVAPDSPNMEAKAEARVRLQHKRIILEPRYWVGWHTTAEELGGYAWGAALYAGVGW